MMNGNDGKERPATAVSLRDLPRSIAPPRDLWPEIEASLAKEHAQQASATRTRAITPSRGQWMALAAVVSALAIGVWLGRTMLPATTAPAAADTRGSTVAPAALQAAYVSDPRYLQQRETMIRTLEARLDKMPPETQAKVGASLATIRKSIQDIQQALGRDPGNALLQELLVNTYQDEMRVLSAVHEAGDTGEEI